MKISVLTPTIRGKVGLLRPKRSLESQSFKDFEWIIEEHDPKDPPDFNQAMNRMLKKAQGELIVFLQDFIEIPPDGLKNFWEAYQKDKKTFWTGPVAQTLDDKHFEWDWRKYRETGECNYMEWEIDWGAAPKEALFKIGGFDETLDKYWGFDNVNVGLRSVNAGYKIQCLYKNPAYAYKHREVMDHPYQHLRNPAFSNERLQDIRMGEFKPFI